MPLDTSPDHPVPVRTVAQAIGQWVGRLGAVWVEGQVTQIRRRPGTSTCFLTLRDPVAEVSLSVTVAVRVLDECQPPLVDGARVVVHAKPDFHLLKGTLSLQVREIRPVGLGELLARQLRVKQMLEAEGLFAAERKRRLPFLPTTIGLICGRASAAQRDVMHNATARWPAVRFEVREVAVQGPGAVSAIIEALDGLNRDRRVDVIVIARGGGSVEDLLPFSDEQLLRSVAHCATPVVSAIGHEPDSPLLDLVADVRASTPTDAARRIVPDVGEELQRVATLVGRARRVVTSSLRHEQALVTALKSRPVMKSPHTMVDGETQRVRDLQQRARRHAGQVLRQSSEDITHRVARLRALSPAATLERGYAIVQTDVGDVVRDSGEVQVDDRVTVRVATGQFAASVLG